MGCDRDDHPGTPEENWHVAVNHERPVPRQVRGIRRQAERNDPDRYPVRAYSGEPYSFGMTYPLLAAYDFSLPKSIALAL